VTSAEILLFILRVKGNPQVNSVECNAMLQRVAYVTIITTWKDKILKETTNNLFYVVSTYRGSLFACLFIYFFLFIYLLFT
jgi:hypothetical protein